MDSAYYQGIWQYDNPVGLSNEAFGSDVTIPGGFDQPCADIWSTQEYQQGSSPSSDQSSMSRAPSTNTSYNEIDNVDSVSVDHMCEISSDYFQFLEPSSPERLLFGVRTHSPIPAFSAAAPHPESDLLFDLPGPGPAPVAACKPLTTAEQYICPEGCPRRTFGRPYELDRHIREQHRCPHEDCRDIRFSKPKEKREHERQHSETGLGYRCGTCVLNGIQSKTLTRGEKLKKHFKETHEVDDDFDFRNYQCMRENCYVSKTFGGIFFASKRELKEHEKQEHSIASTGTPLNERGANSKSAFTIHQMMIHIDLGV